MSTATTTALPKHYQSAVDDADMMGWEVVNTPGSVKLIAPSGRKNDEIVLKLNPPMAPPQLTKLLADKGFIKALAEHQRQQEQAKAQPEPEAPAAPAPANDKAPLVCPECVANAATQPFTGATPQGLAAHRRHVHQVPGSSPDSARKRVKRAITKPAPAKKAAVKKAPAKKAAPAAKKAAAPVPAPRAAELTRMPLLTGLPVPVATSLDKLVDAIGSELDAAARLQQEIAPLREFRDKVDALVHDGNQTPVKVLAALQDLIAETRPK